MLCEECGPWVVHGLLQAERDAALLGIDVQNFHVDFLRGREDFARMDVFLCPAHFGDVDQAFDTIFQLHEGAVIGDVGNLALEACTNRITDVDAIPRVGTKLLHAERDTLGVRVDLDDLDFDFLTNFHNLRRMIDPLPAHVGDVQEAVDTTQVNERTIIGDVLDDTLADVALCHVGNDLCALFGTALFEDCATRDNNVAASTVQLEDLEWLDFAHQWANVANRADVHLATRKEGVHTAKVDREATFDAAGNSTFDGLFGVEAFFQFDPALFAAGLVTGQDSVAKGVFDAIKVDINDVASFRLLVFHREFFDRDAAFGLQTDINQHGVIVDTNDGGRNDLAFLHCAGGRGRFKHCCEIVGRGIEVI